MTEPKYIKNIFEPNTVMGWWRLKIAAHQSIGLIYGYVFRGNCTFGIIVAAGESTVVIEIFLWLHGPKSISTTISKASYSSCFYTIINILFSSCRLSYGNPATYFWSSRNPTKNLALAVLVFIFCADYIYFVLKL